MQLFEYYTVTSVFVVNILSNPSCYLLYLFLCLFTCCTLSNSQICDSLDKYRLHASSLCLIQRGIDFSFFFFFGNWTFINNSNSILFFQSNSSANWRVSMKIIHKQLIDDGILYVSFSCVNECRKRTSISRWNMQLCLCSQTVNFLFSDASGKLCYISLKCLSYSQDFLFRCLSLCLSPQ